MNLSSNFIDILKMTALSVIFFCFIPGCSQTAYSAEAKVLEKSNPSFMDESSSLCLNSANNDLKVCKSAIELFDSTLLNKNNNIHNRYLVVQKQEALPTSTSSEIYNVINTPENGPEWFSIIVSIIAILFSVGIPVYQHRKERNETINEGYWIREVIMPKINNLAFEVCTVFKASIQLDPTAFATSFSTTLLPKLNELRDTFYLFESYPHLSARISELDTICDNFENNVDNNQSAPEDVRQKDISSFHTDLIKKLIQLHSSVG